jgi:hypothetical protein
LTPPVFYVIISQVKTDGGRGRNKLEKFITIPPPKNSDNRSLAEYYCAELRYIGHHNSYYIWDKNKYVVLEDAMLIKLLGINGGYNYVRCRYILGEMKLLSGVVMDNMVIFFGRK